MSGEKIDLDRIIERARQQHRQSQPGASLLDDKESAHIDTGLFQRPPRFRWADTSQWDSEPCPQREWAVKDRIPLRQVTLLSGEGSIGKSIIELMCCVAHVTGKDWLRSLPEPGPAFYIGCEDDESELRIRLAGIIEHYETTFDELATNGFRFVSLAGDDAVLGAPDRNNIIKPTELYNPCGSSADIAAVASHPGC